MHPTRQDPDVAKYKNIELDDALVSMLRHMHAVDEYREVLQGLQSNWDNLALLGQMSGTGMDMGKTRGAFNDLTGALLNQLCRETLNKTVREMSSKAQVVIDILVRNLFERTADIGFLATDADIIAFLEACQTPEDLERPREALRDRFAEYVAKYSVYADIVLLDTHGRVQARLDETVRVARSAHALVNESLTTRDGYVEVFDRIDLLPVGHESLVYAYRVADARGRALGVLCLCFRFDNEMAGVFRHLIRKDDWSVAMLLDADGRVIASSDHHHVPAGAVLEPVLDAPHRVVRFGGQEYLAVSRRSQGYQGYAGPDWVGHVMLPLNQAFNAPSQGLLDDVPADALSAVMASTALFGEQLLAIPRQAQTIQCDLNRSVWNGNVRNRRASKDNDASFSKILLWEVSKTGARTEDVFASSIGNLNGTVVSAIVEDSRFHASLAIDIMDRNLYERANDCRWWALTSVFREHLAHGRPGDAERRDMNRVLEYINGLYTVYALLFAFDGEGRIVAVSRPEAQTLVGQTVDEAWSKRTLGLSDPQAYAVSAFVPTRFYGDAPTYIYSAAIHAPGSRRTVGGVGIVFDAAPQFAAMLQDALPRNDQGQTVPGAFAVFASPDGTVIACSDDRFAPGEVLPVASALMDLAPGAERTEVLLLDGQYYAVGLRASSGYREFKSAADAYQDRVISLVFLRLCERSAQPAQPDVLHPVIHPDTDRDAIEIATFRVGEHWYGLPTGQVCEAIDAHGLTPVRSGHETLAGYVIFEGETIQVFCAHRLLEPDAGPRHAAEQSRQQIIITRRGQAPAIGLLVDALGETPAVLPARLSPLPPMFESREPLAEQILSNPGSGDGVMLPVLSLDRLLTRLVDLGACRVPDLAPKISLVA